MQCWNCGFENLPGLAACGRCASTLSLAAITVEPPRASRWRVVTLLTRQLHPLRKLAARLPLIARGVRALCPEYLPLAAVLWSIIPGLGQIRSGQQRFGRWLLGAWLGCLGLTLLSVATPWLGLCAMMMIMVHVLAIVALFAANLCWEGLLVRALFGLVLFLGLDYALYRPVRQLCGRLIMPAVITRVMLPGVLVDGDGFLAAGAWFRPQIFNRGEVVMYRVPQILGDDYIVRAGYGLDRIIGVPGDHVQLKAGELLVNGAPPAAWPLSTVLPPGEFEVTLGPGEYAIIPSQLHIRAVPGVPVPLGMLYNTVRVRHEDVVGRVLWRLHPLSRFGRMK